jgi:cytochrome c oxidase subunit 3
MESTQTQSHAPAALSFHEERRDQRVFGMWLFLASEVMFFTAFFAAYIVIRSASRGSIVQPLDKVMGAINTTVLITSSLTMALAVLASKKGNRQHLMNWLAVTFVLACMFLVIKFFEYSAHFREGVFPSTDIFHSFYFLVTGFHGLHVVGGMIAIAVLWNRARKGDFNTEYNDPIEICGLYWHFVDLVWIFLYPALYLI